jgi:NTE family protein
MNRNISLAQWLAEEDFGLTMSSGYFGFFAHCGVLTALHEAGLRPARLSGSSSGALITAIYAMGVSIETMHNLLFSIEKKDFWDPSFGFGLLRGEAFAAMLKQHLPQADFAQAQIPCALSAYEIASGKTVVFSSGSVVDAIRASCALPFLFQPVKINGKSYLDGGIKDRPGLLGMPNTLRTLYHHSVSTSPWRFNKKIPCGIELGRENCLTLALNHLPRSGPSRLHLGPEIFEKSYKSVTQALKEALPSTENAYILDTRKRIR